MSLNKACDAVSASLIPFDLSSKSAACQNALKRLACVTGFAAIAEIEGGKKVTASLPCHGVCQTAKTACSLSDDELAAMPCDDDATCDGSSHAAVESTGAATFCQNRKVAVLGSRGFQPSDASSTDIIVDGSGSSDSVDINATSLNIDTLTVTNGNVILSGQVKVSTSTYVGSNATLRIKKGCNFTVGDGDFLVEGTLEAEDEVSFNTDNQDSRVMISGGTVQAGALSLGVDTTIDEEGSVEAGSIDIASGAKLVNSNSLQVSGSISGSGTVVNDGIMDVKGKGCTSSAPIKNMNGELFVSDGDFTIKQSSTTDSTYLGSFNVAQGSSLTVQGQGNVVVDSESGHSTSNDGVLVLGSSGVTFQGSCKFSGGSAVIGAITGVQETQGRRLADTAITFSEGATVDIEESPVRFGKFEVYLSSNEEDYYFRLKAKNGFTILGSEGYSSKSSAIAGIESVRANSMDVTKFDIKEANTAADAPRKWYFNLKAGNGQIVGHSQMYASKQGAQNGAQSVADNAATASFLDKTLDHTIVGKWRIYRDPDTQKIGWQLLASNGRAMLNGQTLYASKSAAKKACNTVAMCK